MLSRCGGEEEYWQILWTAQMTNASFGGANHRAHLRQLCCISGQTEGDKLWPHNDRECMGVNITAFGHELKLF